MITHAVTRDEIRRWRAEWTILRDRLMPNRRDGEALRSYLASRYPLEPLPEPSSAQWVACNILSNAHFREKLPSDGTPQPACWYVLNADAGATLYLEQDAVFRGTRILVGVDFVSGCYFVEGSSQLWDELCAFQGLDEMDINNYVCVAQYADCMRRLHPSDWERMIRQA